MLTATTPPLLMIGCVHTKPKTSFPLRSRNCEYVAVYPTTEEIGPDHQHRKRVEAHFAERELSKITETPPFKWEDLNGQGSGTGSTGPGTDGDRHRSSVSDSNFFRARLFSGLGVPTEFLLPPSAICHSPITEDEAPRPQAQDGNG